MAPPITGPIVKPSGPQDAAKPATAPWFSAGTAKDAPAINPGAASPIPNPIIPKAMVSGNLVSENAISRKAMMSIGIAI